MRPISNKFTASNPIPLRVGCFVLAHNETDNSEILFTVQEIQRTGVYGYDWDPKTPGELRFLESRSFLLPVPLDHSQISSSLKGKVGALFDLTDGTTAPDWTTAYYPVTIERNQKTVSPLERRIVYQNADGTKTPANVPLQVNFEGESAAFPAIVLMRGINDTEMRSSFQAAELEAARQSQASQSTPASSAAPPSSSSVPAKPAQQSAPALSTSQPAHPVASSTSPSIPTAPTSVQPISASPPSAALSSASSVSQSADVLGKRKREEEEAARAAATASATNSFTAAQSSAGAMEDISGSIGVPLSPNSVASGGSAPPSPSSKKQKKSSKKDVDERSRWAVALPPPPCKAAGTMWTLETLQQVVPAIAPMSTPVSAEAAAAAAAHGGADVTPHSLLSSLEDEFKLWNSSHPTNNLQAQISPFVSFQSSLGVTHEFDRLKLIQQKNLFVAPYVLDYMCE